MKRSKTILYRIEMTLKWRRTVQWWRLRFHGKTLSKYWTSYNVVIGFPILLLLKARLMVSLKFEMIWRNFLTEQKFCGNYKRKKFERKKMQLCNVTRSKGPSINYVGKILPIFDPPPPSSAYVVYGWSQNINPPNMNSFIL